MKRQMEIQQDPEIADMKLQVKKCILGAYFQNICIFSGEPKLGYTLLNHNINLKIYGSSCLTLQGIYPKWIICAEIFKSQNNCNFARLAMGVDIDMFKNVIPKKFLDQYNLYDIDKKDEPIYKKIERKNLPSTILYRLLHRGNDYF